MTLGELIEYLEQEPDANVRFGFGNPHSYRGYYDQLAVEPLENTTVKAMLACLRESVGKIFTGYKGGEYDMHEFTDVWLAKYGRSDGEVIGRYALAFMLGKDRP